MEKYEKPCMEIVELEVALATYNDDDESSPELHS